MIFTLLPPVPLTRYERVTVRPGAAVMKLEKFLEPIWRPPVQLPSFSLMLKLKRATPSLSTEAELLSTEFVFPMQCLALGNERVEEFLVGRSIVMMLVCVLVPCWFDPIMFWS